MASTMYLDDFCESGFSKNAHAVLSSLLSREAVASQPFGLVFSVVNDDSICAEPALLIRPWPRL